MWVNLAVLSNFDFEVIAVTYPKHSSLIWMIRRLYDVMSLLRADFCELGYVCFTFASMLASFALENNCTLTHPIIPPHDTQIHHQFVPSTTHSFPMVMFYHTILILHFYSDGTWLCIVLWRVSACSWYGSSSTNSNLTLIESRYVLLPSDAGVITDESVLHWVM